MSSSTSKLNPKQLLSIIEKIGTKIAIVEDNNDSLQNLINTHLPQLLQLLSFPDQNIKNKIIDILSNTINKRLKLNEKITIPFLNIFDLFIQADENQSFLRNFSIIYLEMSFTRMDNKEKAKYCPKLFKILNKLNNNKNYLNVFLRFILESICYLDYDNKDLSEEERTLKFQTEFTGIEEENFNLFLEFAQDFMFYKNRKESGGMSDTVKEIPNNLNLFKLKRILGNKENLDQQEILLKKQSIINFLYKSKLFNDNLQFPFLLIGWILNQDTILGQTCENLIKKISPDFEDLILIFNLFKIYLGDSKNSISPAVLPLKYKILHYLCKSELAVNHFPETLNILNDSLFNEYATVKLRNFGMQFFMHFIQNCKDIDIKIGNEIFRSILQQLDLLNNKNNNQQNLMIQSDIITMKENMYIALGSFARKFPSFIIDRFDLIERYLNALAFEDKKIKISILQGLSHLVQAFKVNLTLSNLHNNNLQNSNSQQEKQLNTTVMTREQYNYLMNRFEQLFYEWIVEKSTGLDEVLYGIKSNNDKHYKQGLTSVVAAVLKCCNTLFPFEHVPSRFLCLFSCNNLLSFGSGLNAGGGVSGGLMSSMANSSISSGHGGDNSLNLQIREECQKGIDIEKFTKFRQLDHWIFTKQQSNALGDNNNNSFEYPSFSDMVNYIYNFMIKFYNQQQQDIIMPPIGKVFNPYAHSYAIKFCLDCLMESAKKQQLSIQQYVVSIYKEDKDNATNMKEEDEKNDFEKFLFIIEKAFDEKSLKTSSNTTTLLIESSFTILKLILTLQEDEITKDLVPSIIKRFSFLLDDKKVYLFDMMLGNYDEYAREKFSKCLALLFVQLRRNNQLNNNAFDDKKLIQTFKNYLEQELQLIQGKSMDHYQEMLAHGILLTVGNIITISNKEDWMIEMFDLVIKILKAALPSALRETIQHGCYDVLMNMATGSVFLQYMSNDELLNDFIDLLIQQLNKHAANFIEQKSSSASTIVGNNSGSKQTSSGSVSEKMLERIITCLGRFAMMFIHNNEAKDNQYQQLFDKIITNLFQLNNVKSGDENLAFTIGEAMACISGGITYCSLLKEEEYYPIFNQELLLKKKDQMVDDFEEKTSEETMKQVLTRLIRECVLNPKKITRQSASIWLLAVTKYSGLNNPHFKHYLKDVQKAFSILVTDNNEVTSEVAGRGLAYVYELADDNDRNTLVNSLMGQLLGNKKPQQQAIEDEEEQLLLFPAGEETKKSKNAPSLSTYKELVDVANEIGKPEMIYQLLSVSNHNAIWNAKKAYAFSMSSIFKTFIQTSGMTDKMLSQLVPKLYRYLFDPNPTISKAMNEMWKALFDTTSSSSTTNQEKANQQASMMITQYLPLIMKEVLNGLNQELWRIRESSCYAICDLISSGNRTLDEMAPFLKECFLRVWRVMDDIKDTCRKAASSAIQKLKNFVIKVCNPMYTSKRENISKALQIIIPLLLEQGLVFPFKDVVYFSIETLKEIVHVSSFYIRPHVSDIITTFLQQMSVLEPAEFNYLQMNAEKYGISKEKIESLRLSVLSRSGPLAECISDCEKQIDENVAKDLIPKLIEILRSGVGLQTRANCARFISNLGRFHGKYIKEYVVELDMSIMSSILESQSIAERKELSTALSMIVKNGKASEGKRLLQEILSLYTIEDNQEEKEEMRLISGIILEQISKNCNVLIKKFSELTLPIMFIARHDKSNQVRNVWINVWEESITTSTKSTLDLYSKQILDKCIELLDHSTWELKRQGAEALYEMSIELKSILNSKKNERNLMIKSLIQSITSGRLWEGKSVLLKALAGVCETVTEISENDNLQEGKVLEIIVKECKKKDIDYKLEAFHAFTKIVKVSHFTNSFISLEFYNETKQWLITELKELETVEKEDLSQQEEGMKSVSKKDEEFHKEKMKRLGINKKKEDLLIDIVNILCMLVPSPLKDDQQQQIRVKAIDSYFSDLLEPRLSSNQLSVSYNIALLQCLTQYVKWKCEVLKVNLIKEEQIRVFSLLLTNIDPNYRQINVRPNTFQALQNIVNLILNSENSKVEFELNVKVWLKEKLNEIVQRVLETINHDQLLNFIQKL
ncbi:hypothetical protein ABK040_008060 [Willaertia magna]